MVGAQTKSTHMDALLLFSLSAMSTEKPNYFWFDLTWEFSTSNKHDNEAMSSVF